MRRKRMQLHIGMSWFPVNFKLWPVKIVSHYQYIKKGYATVIPVLNGKIYRMRQ